MKVARAAGKPYARWPFGVEGGDSLRLRLPTSESFTMQVPYPKTKTPPSTHRRAGSTGLGTRRAAESIPSRVRAWDVLSRVDSTELKRRIWHMSPGLLAFLLWVFPHQDPISPTMWWIIVVVIVGIAARIFIQFRRIARTGEEARVGCVVGYAGAVLFTLLLFPAHLELGLAVLAVLAFGDGSATLGGLMLRGPTLPWNREKTWAGTSCFFLIGAPLASLIYWGETAFNPESLGPAVSLAAAFVCGSSAAFVAAIAESLRSRIDDNIRVGLAAAATVVIAHGWVVGWA